ncbi:MAG: type II/IV secretion system protein [Xanthomonadales bacterium]|nr:type II/IV secretion system protein [Xanthomonadales bacterium]
MSEAVDMAAVIEPAECEGLPVQAPILATRSGLSTWLDASLAGHAARLSPADQLSPAQWQAAVGPGQDTQQAGEMAQRFGLPLVCLQALEADPAAVQLLAPNLARRHRALPLLLHRNLLLVAVADPTRADVLNSLDFVTNHRIMLVVAQARDLRAALARTYDRSEDQSIIRELGLQQGSSCAEDESVREAERLSREQPIVRLVGEMLADAANRQASDIHLRPQADNLAMLYRIDGLLVPIRRFDRALLPALVGRLKVLGGMNIAERRVPQDGRCSFAVDEHLQVDLRLSVIPTIHGEGVVIRLLDTRFGLRELGGLGLSRATDDRLRELLCRSQGLFLVTGPTGSGKTTTLYAALNEVRKQPLNILTVEDPVEYHIDGVSQVQVNRAAGLSFARALRNFLRHDPDVVMVGEIRDQETAEIAVESALTGHLVLSTLHTNSAATTVTRLLDLGIPPFLLQSTLLGVFAQRLARQNCPHCRVAETVPDYIRQGLAVTAEEVFQRGAGCARCDGMGIRGRAVAGELLVMSPALRALVSADASADAIHRKAVVEGMQSLTAHALEQARAGHIALAEAYRLRTD